jgi:hypothetical protein
MGRPMVSAGDEVSASLLAGFATASDIGLCRRTGCPPGYRGSRFRGWHTGATSTTFCRSGSRKRLVTSTKHTSPMSEHALIAASRAVMPTSARRRLEIRYARCSYSLHERHRPGASRVRRRRSAEDPVRGFPRPAPHRPRRLPERADRGEARRSLVASRTTLLGLVKHATFVEKVWFDEAVTGRSRAEIGIPETPDKSFMLTDEDSIDTVRRAHREACDASRRATAHFSSTICCLATDADLSRCSGSTCMCSGSWPSTVAMQTSCVSKI